MFILLVTSYISSFIHLFLIYFHFSLLLLLKFSFFLLCVSVVCCLVFDFLSSLTSSGISFSFFSRFHDEIPRNLTARLLFEKKTTAFKSEIYSYRVKSFEIQLTFDISGTRNNSEKS